ncbi:hypothetical protein HDIA_4837 [Hartmannibacter diazotrophicus]|uniref:Cytochrome c domain-containing protein n=1 Tax=Hartmannibacter diazotrophicus TaxID=1482074 RepID=A0A2C9DE22_9HYPH|nr:hypothetical protein [Hartmannibacter diazotrophicus]SON58378.1 hypothetical protein HDIA_4837 [Hartmannibacter diazotrophicus]
MMTRSKAACVLALTGTLLAGGMPTPAAFAADGDPVAGAESFTRACQRCHRSPEQLMMQVDGATPEDKTQTLGVLLPAHHAADATLRANIIAYLLSL